MKTALLLGCLSAIALGACTPSHATTTSAGSASASAAPAVPVSAAPGAARAVALSVPATRASQAPVVAPGASATAPPASPQPTGDPHAAGPAVGPTTAPGMPGEQKTSEPAPTATPTSVPYLAPDAPPQILAFSISSSTVSPGDVLSGNVTASSNVASVEVRVAGFSYNMTKTAPGLFELAVTIPSVPRMFRRTYPLVAIARNTRGDATQRTTQLTIR